MSIPVDEGWSEEYAEQFRADLKLGVWGELGRAVRLEAFFQYMQRTGLQLDRWDFLDFRLDKAADFLAAWVEPMDGVGEVCL